MNKILRRIKLAYELGTDAEVAEFLNIKPSTLSMQKNRGKLDLWRIINNCENINKNWLIDGEGPMWQPQAVQKRIEKEGIPIFSALSFSEDGRVLAEQSKVVNRIFANGIRPEYLKSYRSNQLLGYIVDNESMHPTIKKNDVVIIDIDDRQPRDGAIYLTSRDDSVECQRLQAQSPEGYQLYSENEGSETVIEQQEIQLVGKVIWLIQHLYGTD